MVYYAVVALTTDLVLSFIDWASFAAASCISFEFCSNVLAVFTLRFDRCLELSLACCKTAFHESKFEKIILFVNRTAETAPSAILLTNLLYALTTDSGDPQLFNTPL